MSRRRAAEEFAQVLVAALLVVALAYLVAHLVWRLAYPPDAPRRPLICLDDAMTVGCVEMPPNPDHDANPD